MSANPVPTNSSAPPLQQGSVSVSVLSLDDLKPTERLIPGEPREISAGVTISVMQSAAEALLEIQESATGTISIDNQPASELATVRPGQIIKTSGGRYVLVRHLQALIVPREHHYERPDHIKKMIELALVSLAETHVAQSVAPAAPSSSVPSKPAAQSGMSSKRRLRLGILGLASAIVIGLCLVQPSQDKQVTTVPQIAKSRVITSAEQAQVLAQTDAVATPASIAGSSAQPVAPLEKEAAKPSAKVVHEKTSAVDALHNAMAPTVNLKKLSKAAQPAQGAGDEAQAPSAARLSEKDRQTIVEYKLEAKFDRAKARVKLKDMAKSFPAGSPARAEVERALGGL